MAEDKQSLCIDILVSGHVQAYVDFFYLTHRPEPVGGPSEDAEPTEDAAGIPAGQLGEVKTQLAEAEVARRRGDTAAVFASYCNLAEFFTRINDQRTSIYFWEKCLEITQLTSDGPGEVMATRSLGMAYEASGDVASAIRQYETLMQLAQAMGDSAAEQQANEHLVVAYQSVAAEKEEAGEAELALTYRDKCLEASRASGDATKEATAHFQLGQAHEKFGDAEHLQKAVSCYNQNLAIAEAAADVEAQGAACFALAQVYQRLQDGDASLSNLQKYLELSTAAGKLSAQAEACCSLGVLYNQLGDYTAAVQYLERYFELAR